jgi:putative ABC transport system permease protein
MRFDGQALLQQNMRMGDEHIRDVFRAYQPDHIENILPAFIQAMYAGTEEFGRQIRVTIAVPGDLELIPEFIDLRDARTGAPLTISNQGAFINGKTAELMNLNVGDYITIQNGPQRASVRIAGIAHNYIYHWIYMTPHVFQQAFQVEEATFNVMLLQLAPGLRQGGGRGIAEIMETRTELARWLSDTAEVITVIYNQTIIDSVGGMLNVMRNVVVAVFTLASGALAFVVLYNLNNINIYERIRELATIKVLGYNDREADMFIYRENIIISALGIAAGLLLGIPIFGYIIRAAEIESMMFVRELVLWNYLVAAAVTTVFAIAINLLMHKRIKEINMVEALKSVE